jgi:spermidine/putrescine transport system permease protein
VSSRLVVLAVPFVVIAIFWLMARYEGRQRHDPTHKGYFERNGMVLGIMFIALVALWALFLVVLPYLYMVVESFHPTLRPVERGGPKDVLTLAQYQSFFRAPTGDGWNTTHMGAFLFSIVASIAVTALNFAICYPLAFYMAQSGTPQKVRLILLALIVPYWVNEILRAFSLRLLLASKGLINQVLMASGLTSTRTSSSPTPSPASPPAAPWCSCWRPDHWRRRSSSADRARCGSRLSSTTSSSRRLIGRGALPTPSCCWPPVSCS